MGILVGGCFEERSSVLEAEAVEALGVGRVGLVRWWGGEDVAGQVFPEVPAAWRASQPWRFRSVRSTSVRRRAYALG